MLYFCVLINLKNTTAMKKCYVSMLMLACMLLCSAFAWADNQTHPSPSEEVIPIHQIGKPSQIPRSGIQAINVSAQLLPANNQIEIRFEEPEGIAQIRIEQMGLVVYSYTCDTQVAWTVQLPAPTDAGEYTLYIDTNEASYVGYFTR